ncbi:hypothetical protein CRG98_035654 [Punica granatum]|uniref:Uncharacterized protein n=1 Tax=Punica granatum TaxID=22663 RepID=A0A2I0IIZ2_PUNGR|nr:hypothetical protein CRG98_035654 [Punica granatum]
MKIVAGPKLLPVLREISLRGCTTMKRVLTLELFMLLPNLQTIIVDDCKEMKEVIGGQELDHGATSSLFLFPILVASPGDQLSTRKLSLYLSLLPELKSICSWTGLRDLMHVIQIKRCPKLKRIEMLDDASPPSSLKEIALIEGVHGNNEKQWWESLEWVHPEARLPWNPMCLFIRMTKKFLTRMPVLCFRNVILSDRGDACAGDLVDIMGATHEAKSVGVTPTSS